MSSPSGWNQDVRTLVQLSLAFHNLNKSAEQKLGLSLAQYHVLSRLRDMPGCSPQKLADSVGMHPSTLTQSLKRLSRKQAVFVAEDPRDSRKKLLMMTRDGRILLERFDEGIGELLESSEIHRGWLKVRTSE